MKWDYDIFQHRDVLQLTVEEAKNISNMVELGMYKLNKAIERVDGKHESGDATDADEDKRLILHDILEDAKSFKEIFGEYEQFKNKKI